MNNWRNILSYRIEKIFEPGARVKVKKIPQSWTEWDNIHIGDKGTLVEEYRPSAAYSVRFWDIRFDNGNVHSNSARHVIYHALSEDWLELI